MRRAPWTALVLVSAALPWSAFAQVGPMEVSDLDRLSDDRDWPAGTLREQLDRDPTLVPFGKGALFVPAMTNPLDEPPVAIFSGDVRIAEGTTGTRIVLTPGTYDVRIGSGSEEERISVQATVRERYTTMVPATWAGLAVHVIDEQYGSVRSSYELIRVDDREYIGIGFGTDEQAGEPISTWILRPGLYKIVRVGETYRARRDFATVRLLDGQLTHFVLVVNPENGDFVGGGEVPEDELFRPREGFFGSLILGGDLSMVSRSNVIGFPDGLSFNVRAFADARVSAEIWKSPLILQLQIEEGQTKNPDLPFQNSNDRLKLDALYVYQLEKWIGPYARVGAETNLLNIDQIFPEDTLVEVVNLTTSRELRNNAREFRLSPPLGRNRLKEGVGLNVRMFKEIFGEATVRAGVGARHRISRDLFDLVSSSTTSGEPYKRYEQVPSRHQVGIEATVLGVARVSRWVIANLELDMLAPFEGFEELIIDLEGSIALKLTSYASVNYVIRFSRETVNDTVKNTVQQDIRLRFSLELL
jgi:hypothetical protein